MADEGALTALLSALGAVFTVASVAGFCGAHHISRRLLVLHLGLVSLMLLVCMSLTVAAYVIADSDEADEVRAADEGSGM